MLGRGEHGLFKVGAGSFVEVLATTARGESVAFEQHPVLIVTAAVVMLIVLWQLLWPDDPDSRFSPRRVGGFGSARLAAAVIALVAAASERVILSIAAAACVVALVAWEAWWWPPSGGRHRH